MAEKLLKQRTVRILTGAALGASILLASEGCMAASNGGSATATCAAGTESTQRFAFNLGFGNIQAYITGDTAADNAWKTLNTGAIEPQIKSLGTPSGITYEEFVDVGYGANGISEQDALSDGQKATDAVHAVLGYTINTVVSTKPFEAPAGSVPGTASLIMVPEQACIATSGNLPA